MRILSFFICVFALINLSAQKSKSSQIFVVEYDFYLNFERKQQYISTLYINGERSIFEWGNNKRQLIEDEDDEYDFAVTLFEGDSIGSYNYVDQTKDSIVSRIKWMGNKVYFVQEAIPTYEWRIESESEKVGNILCQKAICDFRGRTYTAWFSTQFPVRSGPWKIGGLPGIILKLEDTTGKIRFVFSKIRQEGYNEFPTINHFDKAKISIEEYAKLQESLGNDLAKKVMAKMPRGAKIEFVNSESMEIFKE